jgi:dolichol-phosphate mannosyltransferase
VRAGIQWGIENAVNFGAFIEMDCDYSHPPTHIKKGLGFLRKADVVMGSRYPDGIIIGWPLSRRIFSFLANLLARTLICWSIADYTNGYRFYSKKAAIYMCHIPQKNKGYIYLSETLTYFLKKKYTIVSFPIVFVNRQRGKSNTNIKEILSAFTGILFLAWLYRFGPRI